MRRLRPVPGCGKPLVLADDAEGAGHMARKKLHAVGGYPPAPGQTVANGSWGPPDAPVSPAPPPPSPSPQPFGKRAVPPPVKAAGGCSGLDAAMSAHADKVHPVKVR